MPDTLNTLLNLLSQLTGGRGGIDDIIVNYVIAAIFWSAWLAVAVVRYREDRRPRERLLIWGFSLALSRELFMIFAALLQALHLVDPVVLHAVFPPLEHALHDLGLITVAAGFLRYLVDREGPARYYWQAGVASTVACYLATFLWWANFITAHPDAKFGQTWADWLFHINPSVWMLVAAVYLWRNTRGWVRNTICAALAAFFVSAVLKLPDMALGEVYENVFTPISRLFYLGACLSLGYVLIREQMEERYGYARAMEQTMHERQVEADYVKQLLAEAQQNSAALLSILEDQQQTEQALRASESMLRLVLDGMGPALFVGLLSVDGILIEANRPALAAAGLTLQDVLGKPLEETYWLSYDASVQQQIRSDIARAAHGEATRYDRQIRVAEGAMVWIDFSLEPVRDATGKVIYIVPSASVIQERKQAEAEVLALNEELTRHAAELEQRVSERTAALEEAKIRAESADRVKSTFLATMSHELRTPLNSIIGFTGIILQGLTGPLNEEQARQLDMVRSSARHLLTLINDVLDISKIEAGQISVVNKPFDLRASIEKVVSLIQPLATGHGLVLRVEIAPEIGMWISDQRRVEQVLLNLLNNAVKFTERGEVAVTAEEVYSPRIAVRLRVLDTGIGIKPEDTAMLFQPFRQIDSGLTRNFEGTGLGLAICRRLLELMGGEIEVESEWGKGSVFTVILPVQGVGQS
jgi:PAS domain S-box-containing protein